MRSLSMIPALLAVLLLPTREAIAQDMLCEVTTVAQWKDAMDIADAYIATGEPDQARYALKEFHPRIPCIEDPAKPSMITRYARLRALIAFYRQDEEDVIAWGLASRYALPTYPWPPDLAAGHPMNETIDFADAPELTPLAGKGWAVPKGGSVLVNGASMPTPQARPDIPALVQIFDGQGKWSRAFWQDGTNYPADAVVDGGGPAADPKWHKPEDPAAAVAEGEAMYSSGAYKYDLAKLKAQQPEPVPVPEPTVEVPKIPPLPLPDLPVDPALDALPPAQSTWKLGTDGELIASAAYVGLPVEGPEEDPFATSAMVETDGPLTNNKPPKRPKRVSEGVTVVEGIVAGSLAVVAGGLYGVASLTQNGMITAEDEAQLAAAQTTTNLLVIGSGVFAAGAVGFGVTAILTADTQGLGFHGRF